VSVIDLDGASPALPASAGPLIGRAAEVEPIHRQLTNGSVRLLTLCGVGGIGKTRLALEVARTAGSEFAHGAHFVELAPFRDPALVVSAIATSLQVGYSGRRPPMDALKRSLQKRHVLLLLDNFEQVLAAAPLVSELLAACPTLTILATSRAPLRLTWEREVAVGPLAVPRAELDRRPEELLASPAVVLLMERMAGFGVSRSADPDDLVAMAGICRRLDGIPLAIELAAARTKVLSPPALLTWLKRPIELLSGGPRDMPARHQALRSTFDWSYELLAEADQRLFRTLGAFVGGCTFDAAARVCEAPSRQELGFIDALGRLVDSGLVGRVDHGAAEEARLVLLEPVREYALEQLQANDEADAVRERHATMYLELLELAEPEMRGPRQREWLVRLDHEHANALVALRWFVDHGDAERSLRMTYALGAFWWARGFTREGLTRVEEALALPVPEPLPASVAIARAGVLLAAGVFRFWQGDFEAAEAYEHAALALFGDAGDARRCALALETLANCAVAMGDLNRAELLYQQSHELYCAAADQRGVAQEVMNLGLVAFYRGNYQQAHALLTDSLSAEQAAGDLRAVANAHRCLAMVQCCRGDFNAARASVRESLSSWPDARDRVQLPILLEASAIVAVATGDHIRSLRVAAAAAALRDEMDNPLRPTWGRELNGWLDKARAAVGQPASSTAWAEGLGLRTEDAITEALAADRELSEAVGLEHESYGASADDRHALAGDEASPPKSPHADGERLG
jgi:predicted ATPase